MASRATGELTPRARQIVEAARELLEEEGPRGLSMRRLADRIGIRAASIYEHLADKEALEAAVISAGLQEQAELFASAIHESDDPLSALAAAYRGFARRHPHLYRLMTERPLARERLVPGVEDRAALPLLQATGGDHTRARAIWAFAHGMVTLELNGRFLPDADLDAAWQDGIQAFRAT
ncbi:MAG TPA: TetR-like C-terminal domain-containing protein [Actinomycetes bacterium]|jgi:AcrR family transcriptional regulator|nr:TetR-like C-terminal domain-containing protein [Actinomycetes bacterium]